MSYEEGMDAIALSEDMLVQLVGLIESAQEEYYDYQEEAKERGFKELTEEEYDFIRNFGEQLNGVIQDVDSKAKKTTIVADVHTDINTGRVLEEGGSNHPKGET